IYSLTTLSEEEAISRDYIINQKPDFVINIVDSTNLERNLIFTLQLLELDCPVIIVLNMYDLARKKGILIDSKGLEKHFGVPVIPAVASRGAGLSKILDKVVELKDNTGSHWQPHFGKEVESCIDELIPDISDLKSKYPARWIALKLLEKDREIIDMISGINEPLVRKAAVLGKKLEDIHGHDSSVVISDERSLLSFQITRESTTYKRTMQTINERLDAITTHRISGYILMTLIIGGMFFSVFSFGNWFSGLLDTLFSNWHNWWNSFAGTSVTASLGWAAIESVLALFQIAFPYILPFYILLYLLEDWGYIARISFLMDNMMHKMGIHGKACVPFIIGLGCNVPGCMACRIMETRRERFITAVLVTMIPCSAVSVIIFGLVGKYVGIWWAMGLYLMAVAAIFAVGKISSRLMLGEPVELIMPMPDFKTPQIRTVLYQTWDSLKEFVYIASPIVIIAGVLIHAINLAGWMPAVAAVLSPVTVTWLGLPAITGILLIFGILRKELILVMLAAYLGTTDFAQVLSPQQMITLAIVSMFYVPCIATISVLWKEYGWKKAMAVCVLEIAFAIFLAGVVKRILGFVL
ncbi:MAG TPA: ferrous iron transport protein B, partial [Bacteroidales bacterium]|nr:ferrous iron transport protein B [Bacteroidales bacterium]